MTEVPEPATNRVTSRAAFMRRAGGVAVCIAGGGAVAAGLRPFTASGAGSGNEADILNFLLAVEYAQAKLYEEAVRGRAFHGELRRFAAVAGAQEREHIALLRRLAGRKARREPSFDFGDAPSNRDQFISAAIEVEEAGAAAFIGQAANLPHRMASDAGRLVAVDARHCAWIRDIASRLPAPRAADPGSKPATVLAVLHRYGFKER